MDLLGYTEVFVAVLALYLAYAVYARLDPWLPMYGAAALLLIGAGLNAVGQAGPADVLATDSFLLLAGGLLVLILTARGRARRAAATGPTSEPVDERQPEAEPLLDHLEQHPVAVVDRPGGPDDEHVEAGDAEPEGGEQQGRQVPGQRVEE